MNSTSLPQYYQGVANVHVAASDYGDHLVFLHQVTEGAASKSFGLRVAKLAGVPMAVIQAAQHKLQELEQSPMLKKPNKTSPDASRDYFAEPVVVGKWSKNY